MKESLEEVLPGDFYRVANLNNTLEQEIEVNKGNHNKLSTYLPSLLGRHENSYFNTKCQS